MRKLNGVGTVVHPRWDLSRSVEVEGGSLAGLGTAACTNGDPATGIVTMPGTRLAVLNAADGSLVAISQDLPWERRRP